MSFQEVTPKEALLKIENEGYDYLDVRSESEFEEGHAVGALNIPIFFITDEGREFNEHFLLEVQKHYQPSDKILLGCKGGGRSAKACEILMEAGFQNVCNLEGGFTCWQDDGLPCE